MTHPDTDVHVLRRDDGFVWIKMTQHRDGVPTTIGIRLSDEAALWLANQLVDVLDPDSAPRSGDQS